MDPQLQQLENVELEWAPSKVASSSPSLKSLSSPITRPIAENEISAFLLSKEQVTTWDLVCKFGYRLKLKEEKQAFLAKFRSMAKIQMINGTDYVVLREEFISNHWSESMQSVKRGVSASSSKNGDCEPPNDASSKTGSTSRPEPVTGHEIRDFLLQNSRVTTWDLVYKFKSRLKSKQNKEAFAVTLKRITKLQKTNGSKYVVLKDR